MPIDILTGQAGLGKENAKAWKGDLDRYDGLIDVPDLI
jgi:hypothetical protein